jgi:hypothetical protein
MLIKRLALYYLTDKCSFEKITGELNEYANVCWIGKLENVQFGLRLICLQNHNYSRDSFNSIHL